MATVPSCNTAPMRLVDRADHHKAHVSALIRGVGESKLRVTKSRIARAMTALWAIMGSARLLTAPTGQFGSDGGPDRQRDGQAENRGLTRTTLGGRRPWKKRPGESLLDRV